MIFAKQRSHSLSEKHLQPFTHSAIWRLPRDELSSWNWVFSETALKYWDRSLLDNYKLLLPIYLYYNVWLRYFHAYASHISNRSMHFPCLYRLLLKELFDVTSESGGDNEMKTFDHASRSFGRKNILNHLSLIDRYFAEFQKKLSSWDRPTLLPSWNNYWWIYSQNECRCWAKWILNYGISCLLSFWKHKYDVFTSIIHQDRFYRIRTIVITNHHHCTDLYFERVVGYRMLTYRR